MVRGSTWGWLREPWFPQWASQKLSPRVLEVDWGVERRVDWADLWCWIERLVSVSPSKRSWLPERGLASRHWTRISGAHGSGTLLLTEQDSLGLRLGWLLASLTILGEEKLGLIFVIFGASLFYQLPSKNHTISSIILPFLSIINRLSTEFFLYHCS